MKRSRFIFIAVTLIGAGTAPALACDDPVLFAQILADPGNIEISMDYGECALSQGELEYAVSTFERVLDYDPEKLQYRSIERARLGCEQRKSCSCVSAFEDEKQA